MSFCPHQIAISLLLDGANEFFQLFLCLFETSRVWRLRRSLCAPGRATLLFGSPAAFPLAIFAAANLQHTCCRWQMNLQPKPGSWGTPPVLQDRLDPATAVLQVRGSQFA